MGSGRILVIGELLPGRARARRAALAEAEAVLFPIGVTLLSGGPLAERGRLYWLSAPPDAEPALVERAAWLGYTSALLVGRPSARPASLGADGDLEGVRVRWQGAVVELERVFSHDAEAIRALAPDRRPFLYEDRYGQVREVEGYRGGRRGLPITDARLVLNLSRALPGSRVLDPYAGAGAIVREAVARGMDAHSTDIDASLRHGLRALGAAHSVADARWLPYPDECFDAIATEPPYLPELTPMVADSLPGLARVLKPGGSAALFCATHQTAPLTAAGEAAGLICAGSLPVDRKGTGCAALVLRRPR